MKFNIKKTIAVVLVLSLAFALAACGGGGGSSTPASQAPASEAPAGQDPAAPAIDYPTRDISVVVPWGAGGGTDLTVRSLVDVMQRELGVNMPVLNQGGASGSVGTQDVFDSPRDGYKILGNSMSSIATHQVMGLTDIPYTEWYAWLAAFTPNTIVVSAESEYQTIDDLIAAMRAGDSVTMGSAGAGSSGHVGGVVFANGVGGQFTHIPYEGGGPAITATLGGEVDFNAQLLNEMIDHIRSGSLRALATMSDQDMTIKGADGQDIVIPSLKNAAPDVAGMLPLGGSFGLMIPRDTSPEIVEILDTAYAAAVKSNEFAEFSEERGMVVRGFNNAQTDEYLKESASKQAWTLADAGLAAIDPASLGIPRP